MCVYINVYREIERIIYDRIYTLNDSLKQQYGIRIYIYIYIIYISVCVCIHDYIDHQHHITYTGIENLCSKRDEVHKQIVSDQEEKHDIEKKMRQLTQRLDLIHSNLNKRLLARDNFDDTIQQTEAAYTKVSHIYIYSIGGIPNIVNNSHILLYVSCILALCTFPYL